MHFQNQWRCMPFQRKKNNAIWSCWNMGMKQFCSLLSVFIILFHRNLTINYTIKDAFNGKSQWSKNWRPSYWIFQSLPPLSLLIEMKKIKSFGYGGKRRYEIRWTFLCGFESWENCKQNSLCSEFFGTFGTKINK